MNIWGKLGVGVLVVGAGAGLFYGGMKFEEDRQEQKKLDALKKSPAAGKLVDAMAAHASAGLQALGASAESVQAALQHGTE
jgi:hypothetical protein